MLYSSFVKSSLGSKYNNLLGFPWMIVFLPREFRDLKKVERWYKSEKFICNNKLIHFHVYYSGMTVSVVAMNIITKRQKYRKILIPDFFLTFI